jgi:hypothetical protein
VTGWLHICVYPDGNNYAGKVAFDSSNDVVPHWSSHVHVDVTPLRDLVVRQFFQIVPATVSSFTLKAIVSESMENLFSSPFTIFPTGTAVSPRGNSGGTTNTDCDSGPTISFDPVYDVTNDRNAPIDPSVDEVSRSANLNAHMLVCWPGSHEYLVAVKWVAVSDPPPGDGVAWESELYAEFLEAPPDTQMGGWYQNAPQDLGDLGEQFKLIPRIMAETPAGELPDQGIVVEGQPFEFTLCGAYDPDAQPPCL